MPAQLPPNSIHAIVAMITQLRIDLEKLRIQVEGLMRQNLAIGRAREGHEPAGKPYLAGSISAMLELTQDGEANLASK